MTRSSAKLTASTILAGTIALTACAGSAPQQKSFTLEDAPATRALLERKAAAYAMTPTRFPDNSDVTGMKTDLYADIAQAEEAVRLSPYAMEPRRALAKAYLRAGRIVAANDAWDDLLAMDADNPDNRLGAAIAAIAGNEETKALALLSGLGGEPDHVGSVGLAYVLLGDIPRGIELLEGSVRAGESTARTRQNLAFAQAMAGNWNQARETAAIDLTPQDVAARVAEWAALSASKDPAWRAGILLDIRQVASDPGRPVQLAYAPPPAQATQYAEAEVVEAVAVVETPSVKIVDVAVPAPVASPALRPIPQASKSAPEAEPAPVLQRVSAVVPIRTVSVPVSVPEANEKPAPRKAQAKPAAEPAKPPAKTVAAAKPLPKQGAGEWLVQLGSYLDPADAKSNWDVIKRRTAFLADYEPSRSQAMVDGTSYYRLSVGKFDSRADALTLCEAVQAAGESCFVRAGKYSGEA